MPVMDITVLSKMLAAALGISLTVERIIEFCKNFLEPRIGSHNTRVINKLSEIDEKIKELKRMHELNDASLALESGANKKNEIHKKISELKNDQTKTDNSKKQNEIKAKIEDLKAVGEWDESFPKSKVLVTPATDPDDGSTLRAFVIQLIGFSAGIFLARFFQVQLFHALNIIQTDNLIWLDYLLTGLLIGGGSAPIHTLIRFITERKIPADKEETASGEKTAVPAVSEKLSGPAIIKTPAAAIAEEWTDIPYSGGVDRDLLENIHKRNADPDEIIYHHTAMNLNSTFNDVVQVIKNRTDSAGKKWLTGYNCVILADGSVNAFCRWDRYGSHAVGHNMRSLGITFNGNFETDPKVPFSNPAGRYGPSKPTEEQLKTGARVVALWCFLYKIRPDYKKSIFPHKQVAEKTCPGNIFPYDEFKKLVDFYWNRWSKSSFAKDKIAEFSRKPYLHYVKEV